MKKTIFKGVVNGQEFDNITDYNAAVTEALKSGKCEAGTSTQILDIPDEPEPELKDNLKRIGELDGEALNSYMTELQKSSDRLSKQEQELEARLESGEKMVEAAREQLEDIDDLMDSVKSDIEDLEGELKDLEEERTETAGLLEKYTVERDEIKRLLEKTKDTLKSHHLCREQAMQAKTGGEKKECGCRCKEEPKATVALTEEQIKSLQNLKDLWDEFLK